MIRSGMMWGCGSLEQRGTHATGCAEGFRASGIDIDACDIWRDQTCGSDSEFWVGRSDLVDVALALAFGVQSVDDALLLLRVEQRIFDTVRRQS